jgi:hypothetical protein
VSIFGKIVHALTRGNSSLSMPKQVVSESGSLLMLGHHEPPEQLNAPWHRFYNFLCGSSYFQYTLYSSFTQVFPLFWQLIVEWTERYRSSCHIMEYSVVDMMCIICKDLHHYTESFSVSKMTNLSFL